jgi:drug/metabolite transporter (DMT)-like permease
MTSVAQRLRDWGLLMACNLIWASQFVMVKLVQQQMGPLFAVTFPMAISTVFLWLLMMKARRTPVARKDILGFVLLGVLGQCVAQLFITWGVRLSLASNAALISLALPVSTAVMAHFLLGERMSFIRWLSFGIAIAGLVFCSGVDWREVNLTSASLVMGNLMIFASVNGSAFYNTYSKRLLARYGPLEVLLYSYYALMALLIPITAAAEPGTLWSFSKFTATTWLGLAVLALFQYFLSMVIFLIVLARIDATQAALSNYLIPFFGVLIAAVVLGERLAPSAWAGGAMTLASTFLITVADRESAR